MVDVLKSIENKIVHIALVSNSPVSGHSLKDVKKTYWHSFESLCTIWDLDVLALLAFWTINMCVASCFYSSFKALTCPGKEKCSYLYNCIHIQFMPCPIATSESCDFKQMNSGNIAA